MAGRTIGEEFSAEMTGRAVLLGPAIAGAVLLGPVGILLGLVVSGAIVASGSDNSPSPPPDGNPPKK